ncbi:hypothetical protein QAD02_007963 [Eretmocerus hayati]|uniref:Uncharacterized protein n=1 Tax=Eretmocerus hayati TaxID=131215 RepID=A0ACC2N5X8_9HYME|nr:hypothetical protein QAD02_007963 [Eretmocerus hayati]
MDNFVSRESVTRAEIKWSLHNTFHRTSLRCGSDAGELFGDMFPDSDIAKKFSMHKDKLGPKLLEKGTCILHIVSGSYETSYQNTGWSVHSFAINLYYLFKGTSTRYDDFKTITRCSLFPHKFCPVRWLENSVVLSRAVEMVEPLSVYVKEIEKSPPKTIEMEPFLRKYQTDFPMLPFLQNDLYSLLRGLMTRVVVSSRMSKVSTVANLLKVDLSLFDNLRPIGTVDIGLAAERELVTQKSVKKLDIDKFREQCQKFIISICQKLVDKTSMNQKLFRGATCLSPFIMTRESASLRAKTAVNYLIDQNRMNILDGEMVLKEYSALVSCDSVKKELRNFRVEQRNRKNHLEHQISEDKENEWKRKRAADEINDLRAKRQRQSLIFKEEQALMDQEIARLERVLK